MKNPWLAVLLGLIPFGFVYLYLGRTTMFLYVLFIGLASPLIGLFLGSVIIDGALATTFDGAFSPAGWNFPSDDCVGPFSQHCPRPTWAYVPIGIGWALPSLTVGIVSAWHGRSGAIAWNTDISKQRELKYPNIEKAEV